MIALLLLSCAPRAPIGVHVAVPMVEPPPPEEEPPPPPLPAAFRAGQVEGPPIRSSPSEAWSHMLRGPITDPITTDGSHVYAVAEGRVHCFDLAGKRLWDMGVGASGGVAIADEGPVVGTDAGRLLFLDARDGSTVRSTVGGGAVRGLPVKLPASVAWVTVHGLLSSSVGWGREVARSAAGSVAADGDTLYVSTFEGTVVAADATGVKWTAPLGAGAVEGVTLDAERIYVPTAAAEGKPGGVVALDRGGAEIWRRRTLFQPSAALAIGGAPKRPLLLVPDKDGHLYALDPATGEEVWSVEGFGEFGAQPLVVEDQIYAGNADGSLSRIDSDGGQVWSVPLGAPITGDPTMVHGLLIVGLANGRLVALKEGG